MSTMAPTRKRTMRCRNRSASIVNVTPAPSVRDAAAGSAAAGRGGPPAHQLLQHRFELGLHRPAIRLPLPARELRPVVLRHGEVGPARHDRKIGRSGGPIKPRNPLWHLTKGDFSG